MTARFCPECGYVWRDDRKVGVRVVAEHEGEHTVFVAFAGQVMGGRLTPGNECLEARLFSPDELPETAFPHDALILEGGQA